MRFFKKIVFNKFSLTVFIVGFCYQTTLNAQKKEPYSHNGLAEKIYLQIDNDVYTKDKTIWFKAILINAVTHSPIVSSGVLYVDLINANQTIVESKLIKIEKGIGNGHFDLDESFTSGVYFIRAYTEWNKNFDSDFVFKKKIQIFSGKPENNQLTPIQSITRVDSSSNGQRYKANIFPNYIDPFHDNNLTVLVSQNGILDTLTLKRDNDCYRLDYTVSNDAKLVGLAFKTVSNKIYKTSFTTNINDIDLQFFPESGILVEGISSRIGFKAINTSGKGEQVKGEILNEKNEVIASFKSNSLGMGSFVLDAPKINGNYKAQLKFKNGQLKVFLLPQVFKNGYVLSVKSEIDHIYVVVQSNFEMNTKLRVKGICRGFNYYSKSASLIDGKYIFAIPKNTFPEGVIAFTLFDEQNRPVAERLYFNQRFDTRLDIKSSTHKVVYSQRERIDLDLNVTSMEDDSLTSNLSVLVLKDYSENHQYQSDNILSYFLLSSDLRGEIEQPSFYFEDGNEAELDHLLLTQGWRKYKYQKPLDKRLYKLENSLNVSGVVNLRNSKTETKSLDLMLMTFSDEHSIYTNSISVPGSFNFELNDMYGKHKEIVIQPLNKSKKENNDFLIALNQKKPLPVALNFHQLDAVTDSLVIEVVNQNRIIKKQLDTYNFNTYGATLLDEVVIDGYKLTPQRKKVLDRYGKPNVVISGDDLKAKETESSSGLYSVLAGGFSDNVLVTRRGPNNRLVAETSNGGKGHITLYMVDGIPVLQHSFELLEFMSVDEIVSFEIIDNPKNLKRLYATVYSTVPPRGILYGSIFSIYTKVGKGIFGALKPTKNEFHLNTIPVFSASKEFYSPEYDTTSYYDSLNPDLRLPVYWMPQLIIDSNEKKSLSYYHSDISGSFQIIIEAVSSNGQIGYKTLNYSVTESND